MWYAYTLIWSARLRIKLLSVLLSPKSQIWCYIPVGERKEGREEQIGEGEASRGRMSRPEDGQLEDGLDGGDRG
jgi:hypothetical protein